MVEARLRASSKLVIRPLTGPPMYTEGSLHCHIVAPLAQFQCTTDDREAFYNFATAAGRVEDGKSCTDKDKSLDMRIPPSGVGADPSHHHGTTSIATQGAAAIVREFDSTLCRPPERVSGTVWRKSGDKGVSTGAIDPHHVPDGDKRMLFTSQSADRPPSAQATVEAGSGKAGTVSAGDKAVAKIATVYAATVQAAAEEDTAQRVTHERAAA